MPFLFLLLLLSVHLNFHTARELSYSGGSDITGMVEWALKINYRSDPAIKIILPRSIKKKKKKERKIAVKLTGQHFDP